MLNIKRLYHFLLKPIYRGLDNLDSQMVLALDLPWLLNSPLWDENFYMRHHAEEVRATKMPPAEHYLKIGWKLGYSPSLYFDGKAYLEKYFELKINPLLHFLKYGRFTGCYGFFHNVYPAPKGALERYLKAKATRRAKHVVYTCITNDYDDLNEIACPRYTAEDWDYVCFSDNPKLIEQKTLGVWEVRPLAFTELDAVRNNRWHKTNPHILFPEYEDSLYIDANINFLTSYVFDGIQEKQLDWLQPAHFSRNCLYKEAEWVLSKNWDREQLEKQLQTFRSEGFPEHFGFFENNIIYRRHHLEHVIAMTEDWWGWIRDCCRRDQVSLMYVLWKHHWDLKPECCLNNSRIDYQNYCIFEHRKARCL